MVYNFFDKSNSSGIVKNEIISDKEVAEELHKPIIRKFKRRKVQSSLIGNVWTTDIADMQLINLIKDLDFCYVLLTFIINMHGLFL